MMTLKRFRALAVSYGADLQRWPRQERGGARELLDSSEEAHALLEQERALDEAIAAAAGHRDAREGAGGAQDAALARLRSAVAARIATPQEREKPAGRLGWLFENWPSGSASRVAPVRMRRLGLATSAAFAVIAGLLVGGLYGPAPAPVGALNALLQPATLELLAD